MIENNIENNNIGPIKSLIITQAIDSNSQSPEFDEDNESVDKEEVLRLEIKQLQRENSFLKKKINELTSELNGEQHLSKKKSLLGKGPLKEDIDSIHLSVDFFFKEITNLMNSIIDLFRIQFSNEDMKELFPNFLNTEKNLTAEKKYVLFKKSSLIKKLQKITLDQEDKRYQMLLQVFYSYYSSKQECDKYVKQMVDELSVKTLQLNKLMLVNASKKKSNLKSSNVRSTYTLDDTSADKILSAEYQKGNPWNLRRIHPPSSLAFYNSPKKGNRPFSLNQN